ncbi:MAG: hypothetical protein FGM14_05350 [Flavobacteriales bacterium]|nr:hypothetical protein [Flavobacteriales bacterium]
MKTEQFNKLNLLQRIKLVKEKATYIGARENMSHFIYLFALDTHYVEVFILKNLNQIQWVELQHNKNIISEYVSKVNIKSLFE